MFPAFGKMEISSAEAPLTSAAGLASKSVPSAAINTTDVPPDRLRTPEVVQGTFVSLSPAKFMIRYALVFLAQHLLFADL
jgi:hypothetical protein